MISQQREQFKARIYLTPARNDAAPHIELSPLIDSRLVGALPFTVAALCASVTLLDGLPGLALANDWHPSRAVLAPIFSAGPAGLMAGLLARIN